MILLRDFTDLPVQGARIRNLGEFVGIEHTSNLLLHGNRIVKRTIDLSIGCLVLIAASPVIALCATLVRLLDGGPSFFVQDRVGLDGRRIAVPKLRTMRRGASTSLDEVLSQSPALRDEWAVHRKLRDDPRLIPLVGRFFRRFSLDELPQLWTVVRGDMSLVGPRPFPDDHLQQFDLPFLELRQRVRPGITGLWQIAIRSEGTIDEQKAFDTYYIRNWSVWLDIYLLGRTIGAVLSGRGAY